MAASGATVFPPPVAGCRQWPTGASRTNGTLSKQDRQVKLLMQQNSPSLQGFQGTSRASYPQRHDDVCIARIGTTENARTELVGQAKLHVASFRQYRQHVDEVLRVKPDF